MGFQKPATPNRRPRSISIAIFSYPLKEAPHLYSAYSMLYLIFFVYGYISLLLLTSIMRMYCQYL